MNCPTEFTYSIYVDGELPAEEVRQVEAHLPLCHRCQVLVEALRRESRALSEVMQSSVQVETAPAAGDWRLALRMGLGFAGMVGVAAVCVTAVTWLAGLLPSVVELNLFSRNTWMNLFFSSAVYLADQGADIMSSIVSALSVLIVGLLLAGGLYLLARRSASIALLAGLAAAFATASPASAIEMRRGEKVTVPAGQTVNGTLMAGGDTVTIDGTINGDLISWARRVHIRGAVKGDVLAAAQALDVEGTVEGNIYTAAQGFALRGTVVRNVYAWAQTVSIDSGAQLRNDLTAGCGVANLGGAVGRDAALFCGSAELRGSVARNVQAYVGNIVLDPSARIGGDLTANVEKSDQVQIEPGASVAGRTNLELRKRRSRESSRYLQASFYFWQAVRLIAALLTGVVFFLLWPFLFEARAESTGRALLSVGIGFLVLIATPIAVCVTGITIVGLPLAIIGLVVWFAALYLAKIFVAALIGQAMVRQSPGKRSERLGTFVLALLTGLVILFVGMNVPYLGRLVSFVVLLLGLGIMSAQLYKRWRKSSLALP
jgi:cytoskeletal protein CcmA (bactofilin family)